MMPRSFSKGLRAYVRVQKVTFFFFLHRKDTHENHMYESSHGGSKHHVHEVLSVSRAVCSSKASAGSREARKIYVDEAKIHVHAHSR